MLYYFAMPLISLAQSEISITGTPNFPFRPQIKNPSPIGFFGDRVISFAGGLDFSHFNPTSKVGYRVGVKAGTVDYTYHYIIKLQNGFKSDFSDLPENLAYLSISASGVYRTNLKENTQLEFAIGLEKRFYRFGNETDTSGYTFQSNSLDRITALVSSNRIHDQFHIDIPATFGIRQLFSNHSTLTTSLAVNFGLSPIRRGLLYVSHQGADFNGNFNPRSSYLGIDLRYSYAVGGQRNQFTSNLKASGLKKAVFVEILGSGLLYTINYDTRLKQDVNQGIGIRVGIGKGTYSSNQTFGQRFTTLPINLNYLYGKKRSGLEAGVSITPEFTFQDFDDRVNLYGILNLGYRYQPLNKGLLFRLAYTPVIAGERISSPIGISVGYGFK